MILEVTEVNKFAEILLIIEATLRVNLDALDIKTLTRKNHHSETLAPVGKSLPYTKKIFCKKAYFGYESNRNKTFPNFRFFK